jgi:hypothetical protein
MPTEMVMFERAWWFGAALMLALGVGCGGDPCNDAEDRTVLLSDLPCSMMSAGGVWESHPLPPIADERCYWLEFKACSTYRFENPLTEAPKTVIGYTSFDSNGTFSTVGSGNSFVVQEATDSEVIIRNSQNQLFWLRLVLE